MKITFRVPVGAVSYNRRVIVRPVKEKVPGCYECDCGQFIAGWNTGTSDRYNAFSDILTTAANRAMERVALSQPLQGPLELQVISYVPRPKRHFINQDPARGMRPECLDELPTDINMIGRLEAIKMILTGSLYVDKKQIHYPAGVALYGDSEGTLITVRQIRAGMIDPTNRQLELF